MEQLWQPIEIDYDDITSSANLLQKIIQGQLPALVIKNFYDTKTCQTVSNRIRNYSKYDCGGFTIKKIGVFLLGYLDNKFDYFLNARNSSHLVPNLFKRFEDPKEKIKGIISNFMNTKSIKVAKEDGKEYSCGIIRIHENGDYAPLHRDAAKFEARQFVVSKFHHQLSFVFHIQHSEAGGELVIYKKRWSVADEKYRETDFGYSAKLVSDDLECCKVFPKLGNLIIINPIYYHKILPVKGKLPRISLGMFVSFSNCFEKAIMWS